MALEKTFILRATPTLVDSLLWSDDNQLAAVTSKAIHILTPTFKPGPAHPLTPIASASIPSVGSDDGAPSNKRALLPRAATDDVVLAGDSLFRTWRTAAWSPRGIARDGGCALVTVDHCGAAAVYEPLPAWTRVADLGPVLTRHLVNDRVAAAAAAAAASPTDAVGPTATVSPRDVTVVSVAWSTVAPPDAPGPLLALGTQAGHVSLWHYRRDAYGHADTDLLAIWHLVPAALPDGGGAPAPGRCPGWVTRLAWSPAGTHLAYALSTGNVGVIAVAPGLDASPLGEPYQTDPRVCTALHWVNDAVLVLAKGAMLGVWDVVRNEVREVHLPHMPAAITALVPTADGQAVRVFTVDGQVAVVTLMGHVDRVEARSTVREFLARHNVHVAAAKRERGVKRDEGDDDDDAAAGENDEDEDDEEDGNSVPSLTRKQTRFYGACRSPNGFFTAVLYTIFPINELFYRTDKVHASYIDVLQTTPVGDQDAEDAAIERLAAHLVPQPALTPLGPRALLWDVVALVHAEAAQSAATGGTSTTAWRDRVLAHLDFWATQNPDDVTRLVARQWTFLALRSIDGPAAVNPSIGMRAHLEATACNVLGVTHTGVTAGDAASVRCARALVALAEAAQAKPGLDVMPGVQALAEAITPLTAAVAASGDMDDEDAVETCPACRVPVRVAVSDRGEIVGRCDRGHTWDRCCLTLDLIPTSQVRSCVGCGTTKAVALPAPAGGSGATTPLESPATSTLFDALARQTACPRCGDRLAWSGRKAPPHAVEVTLPAIETLSLLEMPAADDEDEPRRPARRKRAAPAARASDDAMDENSDLEQREAKMARTGGSDDEFDAAGADEPGSSSPPAAAAGTKRADVVTGDGDAMDLDAAPEEDAAAAAAPATTRGRGRGRGRAAKGTTKAAMTRASRAAAAAATAAAEAEAEPASPDDATAGAPSEATEDGPAPPPQKRRGRPPKPKVPVDESAPVESAPVESAAPAEPPAPPKKRGRPPKPKEPVDESLPPPPPKKRGRPPKPKEPVDESLPPPPPKKRGRPLGSKNKNPRGRGRGHGRGTALVSGGEPSGAGAGGGGDGEN
ncbi:hypothetical protein H9P43_002302 [Blastocladiella emersonii ATCC 22665]|nr:hypothetical protein H9P43_002302 [Blastocladiella emersonii ATCC 22665]